MRPMPELEVVTVPTGELVMYKNNAKIHTSDDVDKIARSIEEVGYYNPILAWHNESGEPEIVAGHGRLMAAKKIGIAELPVIFLDYMTDEQRRAAILLDNQLTMNTGFDLDMLQDELNRIVEIDMSDFGFELDQETAEEELEPADVDEDELPDFADTRVSSGDIWRLGDHRLVCGDSTDQKIVAALMDGESADMLLTDPPYNVDYVGKTADALTIENDSMDAQAFVQFITDAMLSAKEVMRDGAAFYVWYATRCAAEMYEAMNLSDLEVRQEIYWIKSNITLGRQDYQWQTEPCLYGWKDGTHWFAPTRKEHNIIDDMAEIRKMDKAQLVEMLESIITKNEETDAIHEDKPMRNGEHPTMKPVALFARLIRNSTQKGETVLDTFAGSGTTAIACEQMGRRAMMVELSEGYCDVIIERWEQFTGKKAELVGNIQKAS